MLITFKFTDKFGSDKVLLLASRTFDFEVEPPYNSTVTRLSEEPSRSSFTSVRLDLKLSSSDLGFPTRPLANEVNFSASKEHSCCFEWNSWVNLRFLSRRRICCSCKRSTSCISSDRLVTSLSFSLCKDSLLFCSFLYRSSKFFSAFCKNATLLFEFIFSSFDVFKHFKITQYLCFDDSTQKKKEMSSNVNRKLRGIGKTKERKNSNTLTFTNLL